MYSFNTVVIHCLNFEIFKKQIYIVTLVNKKRKNLSPSLKSHIDRMI
jgi:hypothetical protein